MVNVFFTFSRGTKPRGSYDFKEINLKKNLFLYKSDDEEVYMKYLRKTKTSRKLQKISFIYFKVEKLKSDPHDYIKIKFDKLRNEIDTQAKKLILCARKQGNSGKKVKKLKVRQTEMLNEVNKVEQECERNLKSNRDEIKARALKIFNILEETPKKQKMGMEPLVEELVDIHKIFHQLMCQVYAGYRIFYKKSTESDAEKKLGTLSLSCCFDYQTIFSVDGTKTPIENEKAELIYYYEVS